jgi:hypothetical protein
MHTVIVTFHGSRRAANLVLCATLNSGSSGPAVTWLLQAAL